MKGLQFAANDISTFMGLARGVQMAPYIGLVGYHNLGDDLLFEAHKTLFPDHRLVPYRKDSLLVERAAKAFGQNFCAHAVLGGGTLINDGNVWISKTEHLLDQGSKMFCLGTGVANPVFEARGGAELLPRWVKALRRFEFVGVRGPHSKETLTNAGFTGAIVTGDTALCMAPDVVPSTVSRGVIGLNYGDVAGNPMWGDNTHYRDELLKVVKQLVSAGHKVNLLPVWDKDLPSNRSFAAAVNHPNCTVVQAFGSYAQYSSRLSECDFFVGQKLHATIMSYLNRVPAIMIEYRPKCRDFMASIGLEEYVVKTSDVRLKSFIQLFERLVKSGEAVRAKSESRILEYKQLQFDQAKKLRSIFHHG